MSAACPVIEYSGTTGAFIRNFVAGEAHLHVPLGVLFGPDGNLYVGDFGSGGLRVANSAIVQSGGIYSGYAGSGSIDVDGGGVLKSDSFIRIGETLNGQGTFNITAGGSAQSLSGVLGSNGGSGEVIIDGINSSWTISGTLEATPPHDHLTVRESG